MFEQAFLGQVRIARGLGQASPAAAPGAGSPGPAPGPGAPSPGSNDARFGTGDQSANRSDFSQNYNPFNVPFIPGYTFPPQYPPDRFNCVLSADRTSWVCTPLISASAAAPVLVGPPYPVVPLRFGY